MYTDTALDSPDILVVDDGYLTATWPFLRDRLCDGLTSREFTVMWETVPAGRHLRDLPGIARVPALVVLGVEPDAGDIAALPELVVVAGATGGAGLAVAPELAARGIPFIDGVRGHSHSRAEMAMALMLAALRQLPSWHIKMAVEGPGAWPDPRWQYSDHPGYVGGTVRGKRVTVVGLDPVGMHVADLCTAFGATVSVLDPEAEDIDFTVCGVQRIHLEQVAETSDIVVVAYGAPGLRLTASVVDQLRPGSLVVTVDRSGIDLAALRARVLRDELAWASDVFETSPVALGDPILGRNNIIHTPGVAGRTLDANHGVADVLVDNLIRVLCGGPPLPWDCIPATYRHDASEESSVAAADGHSISRTQDVESIS